MDTFDVRKYITENNIKEQEGYERRYEITFTDGSTEQIGKHISVSPEDVIGSLKKKYARQGKEIKNIEHIGIKPIDLYEEKDVIEPDPQVVDAEERAKEIEDEESEDITDSKYSRLAKKAEARLASNLKSSKDFLNNDFVKKEHLIDSIRIAKDSDRMKKGVENAERVFSDDLSDEEIEKRLYDNLVKLVIRSYFMKYEGVQKVNDIDAVRSILGVFSSIFEDISPKDFTEKGSSIVNSDLIKAGEHIISNREKYAGMNFDKDNITIN